jgi:hypothetical protein
LGALPPWWNRLVSATLRRLGRTMGDFEADVAKATRLLEKGETA